MTPLVAPGPALTPAQSRRFARHLSLATVGSDGQRRLLNSHVLVIGAGGLGSPMISYLAAAGVGHLTVLDDDRVEESNLQRQIIHTGTPIGTLKVDSARAAALRINPDMNVTARAERLTVDNAEDLFAAHDVVVDGADNFATRYLANDAAELTGTPVVWGTIFGFDGQVSTFWPGHGPMLRDLFPEQPDADSVPSCADGGVLGLLCGWVGSVMGAEAVKLICGIGEPLLGRFTRIDALAGRMTELAFAPDPDRPAVTELVEVPQSCATPPVAEVSAAQLPQLDDHALIDVRETWERDILSVPNAVAIPLDELRANRWRAVENATTARRLVFMCKSGARSRSAIELLGSADGRELLNLAGGVLAWAAAEGIDVVY